MVVGERRSLNLAKGYEKDSMHDFAECFTNVTSSLNETADIYSNARQVLNSNSGDAALRNFFIEESCDEEHMTPEEIEEHYNDMENLYLNDREALLEHVTGNQINPLMGMSFPMHKWILMNMVFDKGGIPKAVAASPKFTITQENRWLIDTHGNRINMFTQQNEMTPAIDATILRQTFDVTLPMTEDTEIVHDKVGGLAGVDHLAIETRVCAVKVEDVVFEVGDLLPDAEGYVQVGNPIATTEETHDVWVPVDYLFVPGFYGLDYDRAFTKRFEYKYKKKNTTTNKVEVVTLRDGITGTLKDDRMNIQSLNGVIGDVRIEAMLDPSNARATTCSVEWTEESVPVEIGNAIPLNTTISPEEVKDISALYNVNQVTKIMSLMKTALGNYKDDKIKESLDISYYKKLGVESKTYNKFDYAPRVTYGLDPVTWRKTTFLDFFDSEVTTLMQRLNDNNVKVAIYGDPDLIRKIEPTTYEFQGPANIGPVELDFQKTVYTSDKRHYTFIGSDKLRRSDEFIIVLNPNKTDRILYRIYDYQMYMSNEIRNPNNPSLPAIHTFERWKFVEYTPVQGRIKILNPRGINAETYNAVPVKQITP